MTSHRGGYDHFVADVTDALVEGGPQELVVGVYDPTGVNTEPIGTQPKGRQGVGTGYEGENTLEMTPSSGIWGTVWLEPVPDPHVADLELTPDLDEDVLRLTVDAATADEDAPDATVVATAYDDADEKVGRVTGSPGEELALPVEDPHRWSPEDPYLYDLRVDLRERGSGGGSSSGGKLLDSVESYFGMRSLGKREVAGTARPTLNGETVWHLGSLESGHWPDGLYTAPTDEALRANLEYQKELGYNMVRKHVKVEPRRWFYHADQLGLLVWQDMPNMHEAFDTPPRDEAALENFERELREVVTEHDTHPSMAVWIPINEGWGINNDNLDYVRELAETVADLDPERLVDAHSGYDVGTNRDPGVGDFKDVHQYGTPWYQIPESEPDRVSALGEYTSPSLVLPEHKWGECGSDASAETYLDTYVDRVEELADFMVGERLSASVYTATTDLENVCNGMITYDREVLKPTAVDGGLERVREAHESLIEQSRRVMGNLVIDVETPPSYVSGGLLGNAKPFEVTVTVSNPESAEAEAMPVENVTTSVSGGLPDDWTVESPGETSFDTVADGESATATWEVTPDSVADGDVTFDVTVEYEIDGERYEYDESRSVSAALLGYWRLENSSEDASSYGATLSLQNGAHFDDEAAVEADYSMRLDGADDYAQISGFGSGILHDAFTERTVATWIRPDSTSGDQMLYAEGGTISGAGVRIRDGTLEAIVARNQETATVSTAFDRTEWTHVAFVFDRGTLRLYVDGEEAATAEAGFDTVPSHVAGSELSANTTTSPWGEEDQFFGGNVDATAVYNLALSDDDVEAIATRSFAVDAPSLYAAGSDPDPFTVSATFSDLRADDGATFENLAMELTDLPDGWSVSAATETTFDAVPDGESVSASWEVTPAADASGSVELEAAVDYESDGERRRLVDGATLDTLNSAAEALWTFDGTTADSTGNGHTATLENGASFDDETVVEGSHSVALDGTDDFVDLAGPQEFLSEAFSARTVTTWIKPSDTAGSQVLYNQGAAVNGMAVRIEDGTLQAATVNGGDQATVSTPFDRTEWTHVAVVFDYGALRLYVDGDEVAANEDVGYDTVSGAYWGGELGTAQQSFWSGHFGGNVDLSSTFAFALAPEQVAALASAH
ncbi:MAG: LamG-like jellyroll fold domain-containing protein [Halosimplex sp.]